GRVTELRAHDGTGHIAPELLREGGSDQPVAVLKTGLFHKHKVRPQRGEIDRVKIAARRHQALRALDAPVAVKIEVMWCGGVMRHTMMRFRHTVANWQQCEPRISRSAIRHSVGARYPLLQSRSSAAPGNRADA